MQRPATLEEWFLWVLKGGLWLLVLVTPLVVTSSLFFPYITGKNFFFRIVVDILFGVWVALAILYPDYRPRRTPLTVVFGLFLIVISLATIFGVSPYHSFWSNFERMEGLVTSIHLFVLFLIASTVLRTRQDWLTLFYVSVGSTILISFYGLMERAGTIVPGGSVGSTGGAARIFSTFGNPIYLATYLLLHFFILAYLASDVRSWGLRLAAGAIGIFELYIFFAAGTRGAILGLMAGAGLSLSALLLAARNTILRWGALGVIFLGLAGVGFFYSIRDSAFVDSRPLLNRLVEFNIASATVQSRFAIWEMAWEGFKERPVLGWGQENFIIPYAKYYDLHLYGNEPWFDRVHNMFLEWLVAAGVLGFLAYVVLFGIAFMLLVRLARRGVMSITGAALFAGFLVAYLVQNIFVFDSIITSLLVMLALAFIESVWRYTQTAGEGDLAPQRASMRGGRMLAAGLASILGFVLAWGLNAGPIRAAHGVNALLGFVHTGGSISDVLTAFEHISHAGSFGITEARERLADLAIQSSVNDKRPFSDEEYVRLISKSIEEFEKERLVSQGFIRYSVTLGKLYQLRFSLTRSVSDRDASIAAYEQAIAEATSYPSSYVGLAETYLVAGSPREAAEVMDRIYSQLERPNPLFYSVLLVSVMGNDFERAIQQVETYLAYARQAAGPSGGYEEDASLEEITRLGREGLHLEPESMEDIARRSLYASDVAGRERFLLVVLKGLPPFLREDPIILLALAETEAQLGKKAEARAYAERALAVSPHYKDQIRQFLDRL